jgi:adenylate cyclase
MSIEIERKYLLRGRPNFPRATAILEIDQGYLPGEKLVERLRRQEDAEGGVRYYRTVKHGSGVQRTELEDETDERTFRHLWELTEGRRLQKRRYLVPHGDEVWEIDEFTDRPLWLAELELDRADADVNIPEWLAPVLVREVTDEPAYTNHSLAR